MKEHSINLSKNFISGWYSNNLGLCDKLIEHYHNSSYKKPGLVGNKLNEDFKKSTDCPILDKALYREFLFFLKESLDRYKELYPKSVENNQVWGLVEEPQIQHYKPGEGFYTWHNERASNIDPLGSRHLVWMVYLNTVNDGGETEFYHQDVKVKAEKGLTLIWPTNWPFTHRRIPSFTEDKYIVTGWLSYK